MFYSKITGGFYNTTIHGNNIPSDAIEITEKKWQELLEEQSNGKIITTVDGEVVAVDPPEIDYIIPTSPTKEELLAKLLELQAQLEAMK
jgi:hypothetical protein